MTVKSPIYEVATCFIGTVVQMLVLSVLIALCTTSETFALNPRRSIGQYGHSVWIRQNGLPANAVNVVLQTREGFLWLGTSAGLLRFDGVTFEEISTDPMNDQASEVISALCESSDSTLWIGTEYNGLRSYRNGMFSRFGRKEGFRDTQVRDLLESRSGRLYVATSIGLYTYSNGKFMPVLVNLNYITGLAEDAQGRIWAGTHDGVRVFRDGDTTTVLKVRVAEGLRNNVTTFLFADRKGNVWIGTADGLARWRNGTITNYTVEDGLLDNHINTILEDHDGNLWVGTQRGLNRLSGNTWSTFTQADGLTDGNVLSWQRTAKGASGSARPTS
jgi:ligand-binding sensor domain-containing protein